MTANHENRPTHPALHADIPCSSHSPPSLPQRAKGVSHPLTKGARGCTLPSGFGKGLQWRVIKLLALQRR